MNTEAYHCTFITLRNVRTKSLRNGVESYQLYIPEVEKDIDIEKQKVNGVQHNVPNRTYLAA